MADAAPNAGGVDNLIEALGGLSLQQRPDEIVFAEYDDCGDLGFEFSISGWHSVADHNELLGGREYIIAAIEAHEDFNGWATKCYGCCASVENCQGEAFFCVARGGDGAPRESWNEEWKEPERPTFPPSYTGPKNRSTKEFRAWAKDNKEEAIKFKAVMDYARKCRAAKWGLFKGSKDAMRGDETLDKWVRENYGKDHDWVLLQSLEPDQQVIERLEDFVVHDGEGNCEVGIAIIKTEADEE